MAPGDRWDPATLRLIAVTDSLRDGVEGLSARVFAAVHGGATMVQVRLPGESAAVLCSVVKSIRSVVRVPVLVSERLDVALAASADGVYLALDDLSPEAVRRVAPRELLIGASVSSDADVARAAHADFVGIGPVYSSAGGVREAALGPDGFAELARRANRPAVAIGGIDDGNVAEVMRAGASGIAVISALFGSSDPSARARALCRAQDASGT